MKREQKEQRLADFIERFFARIADTDAHNPEHRTLELIAHSPESLIAVAVESRLPRLRDAGISTRIIFAVPSPDALVAVWLANADWVQWLRDRRLLETHEQLVLGRTMSWSGDSMRRASTKTDLFESINEGCAETVSLGRRAFERLTPRSFVIRPRRITASLRAVTSHAPAIPAAPVDGVLPAAEPAVVIHPLVTRH